MSNTYSIIKTGGKQYVAEKGAKLRIEKLAGDFKEGDTVTFDEVLLTADNGKYTVGSPLVSGSKVSAKILEITKDPKIVVLRYRAKSRYHKKNGHKQPKFVVEIQ
ncbi:MAG: large subunit ribosomal protein [Patescibacteria group bacterium]|nr:large subunit ribosomal protein [Patescibacteria group bacterium]